MGQKIQTEHMRDGPTILQYLGPQLEELEDQAPESSKESALTCLAAKPSSAEAISWNRRMWPPWVVSFLIAWQLGSKSECPPETQAQVIMLTSNLSSRSHTVSLQPCFISRNHHRRVIDSPLDRKRVKELEPIF